MATCSLALTLNLLTKPCVVTTQMKPVQQYLVFLHAMAPKETCGKLSRNICHSFYALLP